MSIIKQIKQFLLFHVAASTCGFILFLCLFHIRFFDFIEIYFYKGILLLFLSAIICGLLEVVLKIKLRTKKFDYRDIMSSIVIIICVNMVWLSTVIVNVDRSFSVWMLSYLDKYPSGYEMLEEAFHKQFIEDYGMLDRRLEEQSLSNNIYFEDGSYKLTKQGEIMVDILKSVGKLYRTNRQYYDPSEVSSD